MQRWLPVGRPAPKFEAQSLNNLNIRFPDDYVGQLVLLHFWASWCPSSARDYPYWVKAQERFGGKGLTLLGVSTDLNRNIGPDEVQATMIQRGGTWEVVYEHGDVLGQRYLVSMLPTLYLVDGDTGQIIAAGNDLRRGRLLKTLDKFMAAKFPGQFTASQPAAASQPTPIGPPKP